MITFIALGSNLGDRDANLSIARRRLAEQVTLIKTSSVYETEPWGVTDQPLFLNQVVEGETALAALDLLHFLKGIEEGMGRQKTYRYGPRLIDLDILLLGELILSFPGLIVPHPRLAERAFVLVPLAEIAPTLMIPGTGSTATQLLARLDPSGVRKIGAAL